MELINFNQYEQNLEAYGGKSGYKLGINYHGERYLLKYPGRLKDRNLKNVELSYSNSPISEYIGSHIYETFGIPVHKTILGKRDEKLVVACKDVRKKGEDLIEFSRIKVTLPPEKASESDRMTNGTGTDLDSVLNTIKEHPTLKQISGVKERFWDMFLVDALIGNTDRNNGNWGILKDLEDHLRLSPVYDNGNSFANKMSAAQMERSLMDSQRMDDLSYIARTCVFTVKGKSINPYQYIARRENPDCNMALWRFMKRIDLQRINQVIDTTPVIGNIEKQFYKKLIEIRYQKVLCPTHERLKQEHPDLNKSNIPKKTR